MDYGTRHRRHAARGGAGSQWRRTVLDGRRSTRRQVGPESDGEPPVVGVTRQRLGGLVLEVARHVPSPPNPLAYPSRALPRIRTGHPQCRAADRDGGTRRSGSARRVRSAPGSIGLLSCARLRCWVAGGRAQRRPGAWAESPRLAGAFRVVAALRRRPPGPEPGMFLTP